MFSNFAWSEILVIAVVAIIVVGPKDLPGMLRQVGKALGSVRRMGNEFQRQFNDAIKEAELDDLKDLTSTKGFAPLDDAKKSMENFTKAVEDSVSDVDIEADATAASASSPVTKKATAKSAKSSAAKTTKTATRKPAAKKTATKPATSKASATRKPRTATAAKSGATKPTTAKSGTTKPRARKAPAKSAAKSTKSTT